MLRLSESKLPNRSDVGTPLEPVWPFYGYDEVNYTTSAEGKALLDELVAGNTAPVPHGRASGSVSSRPAS